MNNLKEATNILLVDDVVDSGKTIESIFQCLEKKGVEGNIQVASVYYKPMVSSITPDYYIHKTNQWIVFPHELDALTSDELKLHRPNIYKIIYSKTSNELLKDEDDLI